MTPATLPSGLLVLERGWLSSNTVVCLSDRCAAVVDTGYASQADLTLRLIQDAIGERDLQVIANTHLHSDHCGGNALLQSLFPSARTLIPPGLESAVRHWDPVALTFEPTGQTCPQFKCDGLLVPGGIVEMATWRWEVHAAPGHDPHSVILFEPQSCVLISADALWEKGFGVVFPELEGDDAFGHVSATLDAIESLSPSVVVPGHGSPFRDLDGALRLARRRLADYERDPARHAEHGGKVLLKFKLLELQSVRLATLKSWAGSTPYFRLIHRRWFSDLDLEAWVDHLLASLVERGALRVNDDMVVNL